MLLPKAQNAGEQSEFGSQTTLRLTKPAGITGVSVYPETAPVCRDCMVERRGFKLMVIVT